MSAARIGKITMKNGGAEIRLIRQERKDEGGAENWQGRIVTCARNIADYSEPGSELCGFVVLGLYSDGANAIGWRYDGKRSPIPRALLPAYVAEVIRTDLVTQVEAVEVFNRSR
jgi:hypothetical protein